MSRRSFPSPHLYSGVCAFFFIFILIGLVGNNEGKSKVTHEDKRKLMEKGDKEKKCQNLRQEEEETSSSASDSRRRSG